MFMNCQGLTVHKLAYLEKLIELQKFDIIIIAEHWFPKNHRFLSSPFLVATSPQSSSRFHGHQNDGILFLANSKLKALIHIIHITPFTITFSVNDTTICGCYFPPRLNDHSIHTIINSLPSNISLICGDLNFRLGSSNRDTTTNNFNRLRFLQEKFVNMALIQNSSSNCSRTDHVLSDTHLTWSYHRLNPMEFPTDYGFMTLKLNTLIKRIHHPHIRAPFRRFDMSPLDNQVVRLSLSEHYDRNISSNMDCLIAVFSDILKETPHFLRARHCHL